MKPITRIEHYLAAIAGLQDYTPEEPITRLEKYLAYINGKTDGYPEPVTRIDQLIVMQIEKTDLPFEPIRRLERILAGLCNEPVTREESFWLQAVEAMNSGIPKGYIPLAYIESTGTQYIDLGIKPSDDMEFEIEYQSLAARATKLFGCEANSRSLFDAYNVGKNGATIRVFAHGGNNGGSPTEITTIAGQKNILKLVIKNGNYSVYVNGELVATSPAVGTIPNLSIFLFASNRNGSPDGYGSQIVYGCRVRKSGELVCDFRPYLNNNGEAGMYNTVSRKFHKNLGTGEFIAGYGFDSYVHDGMISFTDAELGLDGSTLKNLAGDNYDMTITGSLPYADKGLTFDGTSNNYIKVPSFTELANTAELTCEMAMNLTNIGNTQRLLYLKDFLEFFARKGKLNSDLHLDGEPRENLQGNANTGFITFAAVFKANEYQKLLINGVQVSSTSAVSPSSVPASGTIGAGSGYPIANGSKFYSMRVYKRALTDEELAQNFEIDQARFGLTETASVMMLGGEVISE